MHRIVVDEKKWIDEPRFLHALNFCMLLPGPEAQQLATYIGWLLHGVRGGLAAGILFVLPGAFVMLGLSLLYALGRGIPLVDGALFGIKAAVLVIVVEALIRIGRRALKSWLLIGVAAAAFIGIFFFALPFPLIVAGAALTGYLVAHMTPKPFTTDANVEGISKASSGKWRQFAIAIAVGLIAWWTPVAITALAFGPDHVLVSIGTFCSKLAVVSFGGAYALLAYMAQQAVETYGWLTAAEMVDGLGLAETTPGPLILVTQFVGFLAAYRDAAPFCAGHGRNSRRGHDHLGDVHRIDAVDFRRRAFHRGIARQPAARRRACRHHRGGGRRHPQSLGLVRIARPVRTRRGNAHWSAALVRVRSRGARSRNRGARGHRGVDSHSAYIAVWSKPSLIMALLGIGAKFLIGV